MSLSSGNGTKSSARRRYRFKAKEPIPALVQTAGNWEAGLVHNLSPRGAFVTLDADVWVGEEVKVVLGLPTKAGGRLTLRGLAVWRNPSSAKPGYGLMIRDEAHNKPNLEEAIGRLSESGLLSKTDRESA